MRPVLTAEEMRGVDARAIADLGIPGPTLMENAGRGAAVALLAALPERALHIELPKTARVEFRELYTAILADFVAQAVTLPRGR